jgi:hypothetical protein
MKKTLEGKINQDRVMQEGFKIVDKLNGDEIQHLIHFLVDYKSGSVLVGTIDLIRDAITECFAKDKEVA